MANSLYAFVNIGPVAWLLPLPWMFRPLGGVHLDRYTARSNRGRRLLRRLRLRARAETDAEFFPNVRDIVRIGLGGDRRLRHLRRRAAKLRPGRDLVVPDRGGR